MNYIPIPGADFASSTLAAATQSMGGLAGIATWLLGISLAFLVAYGIVNVFTRGRTKPVAPAEDTATETLDDYEGSDLELDEDW